MSSGTLPARFALVLHGRLGSWLSSASELKVAQQQQHNASSRARSATPRFAKAAKASASLDALRAFAAFTHASLWRHVVLPHHRTACDVYMHSWSPEVGDVLDALYKPVASRHEPPDPTLDKVHSQHLSIHRALALVDGLGGGIDRYRLLMVARLDLLLFRDVPLSVLAETAPREAIFLPHTCVPSRLRLPLPMQIDETKVLRRACSGSASHGMPSGRRMLPVQLTRYEPGAIKALDLADDFTLFVLDYFFVATPSVAAAFGALAGGDTTTTTTTTTRARDTGRQTQLRDLSASLQARFRRARFPRWSHLYWAHFVSKTLVEERGVTLRFVLLHEVDFTLARFWRFGADCVANSSASAASSGAYIRVNGREARGGDGTRLMSPREEEEGIEGFENVTWFARSLRGSRGAEALAASPLREQCPPALESGAHILCPWYSAACGATSAAASLAMATGAGRFQVSAGLAPRQLMGAERCKSPTCVNYVGTARKRRRNDAPAVRVRGP